ncbi:MAG: PH domain-containing protein [Syntrophomonadaceae bacterium]|jgi:hypothetical protein|nr:PH domain-containing protein [Syntrophomonadaceae bacterium]NLX02347.1 hypothetical protein [Syntrophomonadaceae bacterium]
MVKKTPGIIFGIVMGLVVFGFSFWGIGYSLGAEDATLKLLLYIPAYLFLFVYAFLLLSAFNLGYRIEDDGLVVTWGLSRIHIGWHEIENIIKVEGKSNLYSLFGMSWPGYMVGLYAAKGLGTARMYATNPWNGFIYIKTSKGFFGITPVEETIPNLLQSIADKSKKAIEHINMDVMDPEVKGENMQDDNFYRILFRLNIIFLAIFALYLAIFFPGSGAPPFTVLLLVLAVALFFFNIGNAGRLFQFSSTGGYVLQVISLAVTGLFIILALSEITLK